MFKLEMGSLPDDADLCAQPTISRPENLPDARALLRMGRAMVDHFCQSLRQVPRRITRDVDDTFDAGHGGQQLRLFNAHYDEYGFLPIVVFDDAGRMIAAVLRPASRPTGRQIVRWLQRLITALRSNWPRVEIMLRADSHYCTPEVLRHCRARRLDYTLGVAPTVTLRGHVLKLEESTAARAAAHADGSKLRRFKEFYDGAGSWGRVERIIARVAAGRREPTRSIRFAAQASSPGSPACRAGRSTRPSTVRTDRPKTTSRRGRRISRPIARHARTQGPARCACFCGLEPVG